MDETQPVVIMNPNLYTVESDSASLENDFDKIEEEKEEQVDFEI